MPINPTLVTASQLQSLIHLLMVLIVDYRDNGPESRPDKETAAELQHLKPAVQQWAKSLPALTTAYKAAVTGANKASTLALLGEELRSQFSEFRANERFSSDELEVLRACIAYLRTDSVPALKKLEKMAGVAHSPYVSKRMVPQAGSQDRTSGALQSLVQQMVGRNDTALTVDEAKQVKELHPDLYKEYLAYRREHNQVWKDTAVAFVRNSGHKAVPYEDLIDYLHANGIDHMLPTGFTGLVDDRLRMYTRDGHLIDGVPNAVTFPSVVMNPTYGKAGGGDYVFKAVRSGGQDGPPFYTVDFKRASSRAKFEKVADFMPRVEGMQKKWFNMVRKFNEQDIKCVCAVVLEILYEFSARIGSLGNATGGQSTFGVSTLLVKHVLVSPNGDMVLRYKGKDGVQTRHRLSKADPFQKFVIADIMKMLPGKKPNDRLFTYEKNGKWIPVSGAQVNALFKSMGAPEGVTVHKLRTVKGTHVFNEMMEKVFQRPPKDEKRAMEIYVKMTEQVGKVLNHVRRGAGGDKVTGTTARANYIDPEAQLMYWRELGFRPPKFLERFME